jgi:hypothetical protein
MMLSVRSLFSVLLEALVQLVFSVSLHLAMAYSLNLTSDSPGFLRAGRNHVYFVKRETLGIGCPAVSVSCSGGTAGVTYSYCILSMII